MDPVQCLLDARTALLAYELDTAQELLLAYRAWRAKGGFEPADVMGVSGDQFVLELAASGRWFGNFIERCDYCKGDRALPVQTPGACRRNLRCDEQERKLAALRDSLRYPNPVSKKATQ